MGGVVALLALFFQLAIGLTHVHLTNVHAHAVHAPFVTSVSLAAHSGPAFSDEHRSHGPHSGITCDLCVLLHAGAVGDLTTPPVLSAPSAALVPGLSVFAADRPADAARHFLPQSRAPPAA